MEALTIKNWEKVKQQIKKEYPALTSDDLIFEAGKEIDLIRRIMEKSGKQEQEIRKWLSLMG